MSQAGDPSGPQITIAPLWALTVEVSGLLAPTLTVALAAMLSLASVLWSVFVTAANPPSFALLFCPHKAPVMVAREPSRCIAPPALRARQPLMVMVPSRLTVVSFSLLAARAPPLV